MKANSKIILGALAGAVALLAIRKKTVSGIGAAKRRIYKEISLAQKAGVDFTKKYEELTEDEIEALERVSSNTGYTETYYKGLKKAYDAISGIGEAYDVTDEDGNTVLTWIEDPEAAAPVDESDRWQALLDARTIEDDRQYASENRTRDLEEREKRLAAQRRKLAKSGRTAQMALFGCGYAAAHKPFWYGIPSVQFIYHGEWADPEIYYRGRYYNATAAENELYEIWRNQIEYDETRYDFDEWMQKVGGDYLKTEVLPYMQ